MSQHTETELKLACPSEEMWEAVWLSPWLKALEVPDSRKTEDMEARYYDTPTLAFRKEKLAFRIRKEGERWVATVKGGGSSQGGLHERQEWNVEISRPAAELSIFSHTPVGSKMVKLMGAEPLHVIVVTRFERRSFCVRTQKGTVIEVAVDKGVIIAEGKRAPILEVELELKEGSTDEVLALGDRLMAEYSLVPEGQSKYYRGLVLAGLVKEK